jgi:hypothetical protein
MSIKEAKKTSKSDAKDTERSRAVVAAIAQIKVAPSVKDLQQLRTQLLKLGTLTRHRDLAEAIDANLAALSSPRLHRSP